MKGSLLIIGLGFMGGSLAKALRESGFEGEIFAIDVKREAIEKGLSLRVIDRGWTHFPMAEWRSVGIVVLATPVGTFRDVAEEVTHCLNEDVVVTDLGSVKGRLVYDLEKVIGDRFVGGHPIAGTEKSGVENSIGDLFRGKKVVLTPTENTDEKAIEIVEEMWKRCGAIVERMDPFVHDWVFGAVSHLPHAVAFALIEALRDMSKLSIEEFLDWLEKGYLKSGDYINNIQKKRMFKLKGIDLFKYPGAGFKDFTRIAKSDPIMWRDIFLENRENTIRAIDVYISCLEKLKKLIEEGKKDELTDFLKEVKERRMEIE